MGKSQQHIQEYSRQRRERWERDASAFLLCPQRRERGAPLPIAWLLLSWARGVITWYYAPVPVEGEYNLEKGSCHCQVGRLYCIRWGKVWFPVWESKLAISLSNFIPSWDFWPIVIRINERYRFISSCAASFCWLGV